jgi:hypothetical protein
MGVVVSGCNAHVFSPPARAFNADGPAVLGEGKTEIQGQFALGGKVFGGGYYTGKLHVRHGLSDELDITVDTGAVVVETERTNRNFSVAGDESKTEQWPIYAARVGVQWSPKGGAGHIGLTGGLGGGYSDGGGFASPDVGFSIGYNNPYVVPYFSMTGFLSIPIAPQGIDVSRLDEPADIQEPEFSFGVEGTVGIRGKIAVNESQQLVIMAGASMTILKDFVETDAFMSYVLSLGYRF